MSTLLKTKPRPGEGLVRDLPGEAAELLYDASERLPTVPAADRIDPIDAAHEVAWEIHDCWGLSQRLRVYGSVGRRFKSDARRILNIAAARWPELIPMVNDMPEWKALLSADLS